MKTAVLALLRAYQFVLRPFFAPCCRFAPSCSEYACEAVVKYGAFKGMLLAARRIARCHPYHPGGYDPVP